MPQSGGYLLDTNIILALVRNNNLGRYLDATFGLTTGAHPFFVSVVSVGELYALANKFRWGPPKRASLTALLPAFVLADINHPSVLIAYGDMDAASDAAGRPMGKNDVWIAATARVANATLLTSDHDFDHLHGVWIDREWVDPGSKLPP
jgi:predicted nucleic acid-binding protein